MKDTLKRVAPSAGLGIFCIGYGLYMGGPWYGVILLAILAVGLYEVFR